MTVRQLSERGYRILLEGLSAVGKRGGMNIAGEALLIYCRRAINFCRRAKNAKIPGDDTI
jgi:hypothetical protein